MEHNNPPPLPPAPGTYPPPQHGGYTYTGPPQGYHGTPYLFATPTPQPAPPGYPHHSASPTHSQEPAPAYACCYGTGTVPPPTQQPVPSAPPLQPAAPYMPAPQYEQPPQLPPQQPPMPDQKPHTGVYPPPVVFEQPLPPQVHGHAHVTQPQPPPPPATGYPVEHAHEKLQYSAHPTTYHDDSTAPLLQSGAHAPKMVACGHCGHTGYPKVFKERGSCTWIWAIGLCLVGLWPLCCVPFCCRCSKDNVYRCAQCNAEIDRKTAFAN